MEFLSPKNGEVDLTVNGTTKSLKDISASSFDILMDLSGLSPGVHEVNLKVDGPKDITWELSKKKAKIRLTEKESGDI